MNKFRINLGDATLFGNHVAEDEKEDVFFNYVVERSEVNEFADPDRPLCFVRAYKGEGKSALLRVTAKKLRNLYGPEAIIIHEHATAISPDLNSENLDAWIRAWKAVLFNKIAQEVGARIGMAWSDDAMSLVEEAEKSGAKDRGIVFSILDRIKTKPAIKVPAGVAAEASIEFNKIGAANNERTLQRWASGKDPIWIIVDDIDLNFQNTPQFRTKVAAFFIASRQVRNALPEIHIRAAIRPNVWTTLKLFFEPLSHVEQYIVDLSWSEDQMRTLLAKRIQGYLVRRNVLDRIPFRLENSPAARELQLISLAFERSMQWAGQSRSPHTIMYTLSKHRPRWVIELAAQAGKAAHRDHTATIDLHHITDELDEFGRRRVADTVAEFRSQCPEVEEIIAAFRGAMEEMATDELFTYIKNFVLNHINPKIAGIVGSPTPRDIAAFLFEIGVIFARRDLENGEYEHFGYPQRPSLLRGRTSLDQGLRWEIHPVFRQVLEIRDAAGREYARPRRNHRI